MGKTADIIKKTVAPKNGDGKLDLKKFLKRWAIFMTAVGIFGTVWTAFSYVKDKLDAIEESTANIVIVKNQNAELAARIEELESTLVEAINERTLATQREFSQQREVDIEMWGSVDSVLTEVRIRHGAPLTDGARHGSRVATTVREATREADRAQIRTENAMPQAGPLPDIDELD